MLLERFTAFVAHAAADGVVFFHDGPLDEAAIADLGAMLRRRLQEEGASGAQARKVFTTAMEMAQNVLHYAAGPGKSGALLVAHTPDGFEVMCGNSLPSDQVPRVRGRLESVQEMGPEQVRQAYRRQLADEHPDPDSKGAGLGLLTMAASARAPIEFQFDPDSGIQGGTTFLFLKAII
jgi:hypothetical protein